MHNFDPIAILEQCYRAGGTSTDSAWLTQVLDGARGLIDHGRGFGFALVRTTPAREMEAAYGEGMSGEFMALCAQAVHAFDEATFKKFWYPDKPISFASQDVRRWSPPEMSAAFFEQLRRHGSSDGVAVRGHPVQGTAFMIVSLLPRRADCTPLRQATLARVRIHFEAALRLRAAPGAQPVAVFAPNGKLSHAASTDVVGDSATALSLQVRRIEAARTGRARQACIEALDAWNALVAGRWSVLERFDSDGKRFYLAYENTLDAPRYGALSSPQAQVLALSAQGLSGKMVAYSLGLSESMVSRTLKASAARLGVADIASAVQIAAWTLRGDVAHSESCVLTAAELEVLRLVRDGLSNTQIAARRNTSVHTVANQVASILKKTGATGRRALRVVPAG